MAFVAPLMVLPETQAVFVDEEDDKKEQGSIFQRDSTPAEEKRRSRESFRFTLQSRTSSDDSSRRQSIPSIRKARFLGRGRNKSRPRASTDVSRTSVDDRPTLSRAQSISSVDSRSLFSADAVEMDDNDRSSTFSGERKRSMLSRLTKSSIVSKAAPLQSNAVKTERFATPVGQVGFAVALPDLRSLNLADEPETYEEQDISAPFGFEHVLHTSRDDLPPGTDPKKQKRETMVHLPAPPPIPHQEFYEVQQVHSGGSRGKFPDSPQDEESYFDQKYLPSASPRSYTSLSPEVQSPALPTGYPWIIPSTDNLPSLVGQPSPNTLPDSLPPLSPPPRSAKRLLRQPPASLPLDEVHPALRPTSPNAQHWDGQISLSNGTVPGHPPTSSLRFDFERPRPAPVPPARDYAQLHAMSTSQNAALPAMHMAQKPLEDVPEEPENTQSRRASSHYTPSPPSTPFRHARYPTGPSNGTGPVQVKPSITDLHSMVMSSKQSPRPDSQMSDTLGIFGERVAMTNADIDAIAPLPPPKAAGGFSSPSSPTFSSSTAPSNTYTIFDRSRESEGSWEEDVDYCYQHEAEADCDFDWSNVSRLELDDERRPSSSVINPGMPRRMQSVRRPSRRRTNTNASAADGSDTPPLPRLLAHAGAQSSATMFKVASRESLPELEQDHSSAYTSSIRSSAGAQTPHERLSSPGLEMHSPGRSRWFPAEAFESPSVTSSPTMVLETAAPGAALDDVCALASGSPVVSKLKPPVELKSSVYESFAADGFEGHHLHAILDSAGRATQATRTRNVRAASYESNAKPASDSVMATAQMLRSARSDAALDASAADVELKVQAASPPPPVPALPVQVPTSVMKKIIEPVVREILVDRPRPETPKSKSGRKSEDKKEKSGADSGFLAIAYESMPPPIPPRHRPTKSVPSTPPAKPSPEQKKASTPPVKPTKQPSVKAPKISAKARYQDAIRKQMEGQSMHFAFHV